MTVAAMVLGVGACQTNVGDAGCQVTQAVRLPGTPLTLLHDAHLVPVGTGFVLIGSDDTTLRWANLAADGTLGIAQSFPLPSSLTPPIYALAGVTAPADTVLVGVTAAAANGLDTELSFVAVPAGGAPAPAAGPPVVAFVGGVATPPLVAFGTSRPGFNAGLAWTDPLAGVVKLTTVDGRGALVAAPETLPYAATAFTCLAFTEGADDPAIYSPDDLTLTYFYYSTVGGAASWAKVDASEAGTIGPALTLSELATSSTTGCAIGTPTVGGGVAIGWEDGSGSWLSVFAPHDGAGGHVTSYPFASATDFGGPDVQPPIVGVAPFGDDYGIVFARTHSVELWRLSSTGTRRPGALIFPSVEGNVGAASAALGATGALAVTYADDSSSAGKSGRWFVDAACY